jgi:hypothetical protein
VITQQEAGAGIDYDVPSLVQLRRPARVREPAPAGIGYAALPRAPGESDLGVEVVHSRDIVAPLNHAFTTTARHCHILRQHQEHAASRALRRFGVLPLHCRLRGR